MFKSVSTALLLVSTLAAMLPVSAGAAAHRHAGVQPRIKASPSVKRGLAFAQLRCSSCHAVTENGRSPNPGSPAFEDIANRPGVTRITLRHFLRDSHNFPAAMAFRVDPGHIRDLADYIATLKKPGYRPVM